jgi:hypothetical protein
MSSPPRTSRARSRSPRTLQWSLRVTPAEPATPWVGGCCQACDGGCPAPAQVHARMPPRRARH